MTSFFSSENPIALFLALLLVVALIKGFLSNHSWFKGGKAPYITLIVIALAILLFVYDEILQIVSYLTPFLALLVIFVFALGAMYFVLGVKEDGMWGLLKSIGPLRTALRPRSPLP